MQFTRQTEPFWTVVGLSLPTFVAFLIVVTAILHANLLVYLLIPLAVIAPICLVCATLIAVGKRRVMDRQLSRIAWIVLSLATLAGVAAIVMVSKT